MFFVFFSLQNGKNIKSKYHLLSSDLGWRELSISTLCSRLDLVIYENMMHEKYALTSCILFRSQSQDLRRTLWSLKSMYECPYHNPDMRLCRKFLLKFNHRIPQIRWHHYISNCQKISVFCSFQPIARKGYTVERFHERVRDKNANFQCKSGYF